MKSTLNLFLVVCMLLSVSFLRAQEDGEREGGEGGDKGDKIEQLKATYLQDKLNLTPQESKDFWPIYNAMSKETKMKKDELRQVNLELKGLDMKTATKEDKTDKIDKIIKLEADVANTKVEFHEKFKKVLPIDKVIRMYKAENDFKREVLQKLGGGKGQGSSGVPNGGQGQGGNRTGGGQGQGQGQGDGSRGDSGDR